MLVNPSLSHPIYRTVKVLDPNDDLIQKAPSVQFHQHNIATNELLDIVIIFHRYLFLYSLDADMHCCEIVQ